MSYVHPSLFITHTHKVWACVLLLFECLESIYLHTCLSVLVQLIAQSPGPQLDTVQVKLSLNIF